MYVAFTGTSDIYSLEIWYQTAIQFLLLDTIKIIW